MKKILSLVLVWCGINTAGEILIKIGSRSLSDPHSLGDMPRVAWEVAQNPLVMLGVIISAVDLFLWIHILKNGDLGLVVPLTSINYIFALLAGYFFFNEPFTATRILGILLICSGTFCLSR